MQVFPLYWSSTVGTVAASISPVLHEKLHMISKECTLQLSPTSLLVFRKFREYWHGTKPLVEGFLTWPEFMENNHSNCHITIMEEGSSITEFKTNISFHKYFVFQVVKKVFHASFINMLVTCLIFAHLVSNSVHNEPLNLYSCSGNLPDSPAIFLSYGSYFNYKVLQLKKEVCLCHGCVSYALLLMRF